MPMLLRETLIVKLLKKRSGKLDSPGAEWMFSLFRPLPLNALGKGSIPEHCQSEQGLEEVDEHGSSKSGSHIVGGRFSHFTNN